MTLKKVTCMILVVLISVSVFAPLTSLANASFIYRTLEYGDSGEDVKMLQKQLKKLGFFSGDIGGNYLDKTQHAVKNFQAAKGYKQTGYCSKSMQRTIQNQKVSGPYRTLHYGDSGEDVKALQKALKKLGYFHGDIGGNYLKQTQQAVKDAQARDGYKITSYCTASAQARIIKHAK